MAKKNGGGVYKIVEVVGISKTSWEDAGRKAVEVASKSLRDLRVAEVIKTDMKVENGKVTAYRTRVSLSFKLALNAAAGQLVGPVTGSIGIDARTMAVDEVAMPRSGPARPLLSTAKAEPDWSLTPPEGRLEMSFSTEPMANKRPMNVPRRPMKMSTPAT